MNRRAALGLLVGSLVGCLGRREEPLDRPSDEADPDDHTDRGSEAVTDRHTGTDSDDERRIVAYEDLSERGQRFVDEARGISHTLYWISEDDERTYVQHDRENDRWVRVDDPLTLDSVDEELVDVFEGNGYVEIEDRYYEGLMSVGHGPYRTQFTAEEADACDEVVDEGAFSKPVQRAIDALVDRGDAWVASIEFEGVAEADAYVDDEDRAAFLEAVVVPDGACLQRDGRRYRVEYAGDDLLESVGYELARAEEQPDD